jgi:hypothetical protein
MFLIYKIIEILNSDGMRAIAIPVIFLTLICLVLFLILDRFLINKMTQKKIIIGEIFLTITIFFIFFN